MLMEKAVFECKSPPSTQEGCLTGIRGNFADTRYCVPQAQAERPLKLLWHDSRSVEYGKLFQGTLSDCTQRILAITSRSKWLRSATGTKTLWVK